MHDLVFLFDVDNTLLDNDQVQRDLKVAPGAAFRREGTRPLLGAVRGIARGARLFRLPRRAGALPDRGPARSGVLRIASWMADYPFAARLYPFALEALRQARRWAPTVILSDGDAVFQPRKVERAGLWRAVDDRVLIFIHKESELADVERLYPARHYVLIDDKLRILAAVKSIWNARVTTVFLRQGHYARDAEALARYPSADVTLERIGDFMSIDRGAFG